MLGKAAKKLGIPIVYYISPQVWVWRKGRIKTIARLVNAMIVVFPFEVPLYEKAGVDVRFVGHPLIDVVKSAYSRDEARLSLGFGVNKRTIALMPGSRRGELANLFPDILRAAQLLRTRYDDLQFILPLAPTLDLALVRSYVEQGGVPVHIVQGRVYDVLQASDAAIVASGTATLETGLMAVPMTIVYRISALTYYILTKLVRNLAHVGLVNIVAGQRIVPELIQRDATPQKIANAVSGMLDDPTRYQQIQQGLLKLREQLGAKGASARAALVVMEFMKGSM
jgi:lipid-A-disaccharide synthase